MFPLYKNRSFSESISDPIAFFKKFGKHYFKNYFTVSGMFLLVMLVLLVFFSKAFTELTETSVSYNNQSSVASYFSNNSFYFGIAITIMALLGIILALINTSYPTLYIKLFEEKQLNFGTKEIVATFKQNFKKILLFFIGSIFIILPIAAIVLIINIALVFIIIGIPLFLFTIPALLVWISLSFNDYLLRDSGFFESLSNGYAMLKINFFPTVGATLIMLFILQTIQSIFTIIPYLIGIASLFASGNEMNPENAGETAGTAALIMSVIFIISIFIGYILYHFVYVQQVLIYYSKIESTEQTSSLTEIDLIGTDRE